MSRESLNNSEWDSWCAADTAGSHLCLVGQQMEQLFHTVSHVARPGINGQECRGSWLPFLLFICTSALLGLSAVCVACPQEPQRQSKLSSILKDHSLNRVRCHNPHCTNATHCKKQLSVHPTEQLSVQLGVGTYFRVVRYEWSSPLLILLMQEGRIQKKTPKIKPQKTPNTLRSWSFRYSWLTVLLSRRSSLSWGLLQ